MMRRITAGKLAASCTALALGFVGAAPVSAGAAPASGVDTVQVTGTTTLHFSHIDIAAQSGTSGGNPTGTATYTAFGFVTLTGPVTCLRVTGPDQGGGTSGAPTTAVLNFQDRVFGVVTVQVVDNGGGGADLISSAPALRSPTDCSPFSSGLADVLTDGRAVVFDAPLVPTSKQACTKGGYARFGFKNQGRCLAFVNHR